MCDPVTIAAFIGAGATLGASALAPKPGKPPPTPASTPEGAKAPAATVRVGAGQIDNTTDTGNVSLTPTVEKRTFGTAIGGLGKSADLVL